MIVLENVCRTLTSHEGKDFAAVCSAFEQVGYLFGAVIMDAALFVPQSRPRLFMIGVRTGSYIPTELIGAGASEQWHPRSRALPLTSCRRKLKKIGFGGECPRHLLVALVLPMYLRMNLPALLGIAQPKRTACST
jgi:site-specific DNA-cytosine methylase